MEDFVALATILLTYSLTEIVNGYGFIAVFVAGLALQRSYQDQEKRRSKLEFTERIEKLTEVGTILLLGSLLRVQPFLKYAGDALLVAGLLIFVIRPLGAWISTIGTNPTTESNRSHLHAATRWLFGWFGIRGVGSIYYLCYALGEGLKDQMGEQIAWITYTTIVISVILHGISATPLMKWYERRVKGSGKRDQSATLPEQSESE